MSSLAPTAAWLCLAAAATACIDAEIPADVGQIEQSLHGAPALTMRSPATSTFDAASGERIGFVAAGADADGDLWGVEWYLDGTFLGVQRRTSLPDADGYAAEFWRGINLSGTGTHYVEAVAFDRAGHYSEPVMWTVTVGRGPRVLYVTDVTRMFGAAGASAREELFSFVAERGFDTLVLYGADNFLKTPRTEPVVVPPAVCSPPATSDRRRPLADFIVEARARGITGVHVAIGASSDTVERKLNGIEVFNCDYAGAGAFDGAITEHEFWNSASLLVFYQLVLGLDDIADRRPFEIGVYLGAKRLPIWQIRFILDRVDRLVLTAYVDTPEDAFPNLRQRLDDVARLVDVTEVWPAFSAEETYEQCERCLCSSTDFMGDWFGAHRDDDPLGRAERRVRTDFRDAGGTWRNGVRLTGFAYYQDRYSKNYLDNGPSWEQARPTLPRCPPCEGVIDDPCD